MFPLAFAVLLALPASPPTVSTSPCEPTVSAVGESVFVASHGLELETQRECLVWEWSVQPKAQFLPPSVARMGPDPIVRRYVESLRPGWPSSFSESPLGHEAFHLGGLSLLSEQCARGPAPSTPGR